MVKVRAWREVCHYLKNKFSPPADLSGQRSEVPVLAPPGCHQCPVGGLSGRERAVAEAPRAQDACPPSAPQPRPEPLTCLRDGAAGRGEAAAGAGRARGAGRAGSSPLKSWTWRSASRPARKCGFGQKGERRKKKKAHNVFLVRDSQAGPRVLLLVPHYNMEMQLDSGQARPRRRPERAAADSHGRRWAAPAARAPRPMRGEHGGRRPGVPAVTRAPRGGRTPRRAPRGGADSATPAPRPPARGRPGIVLQDLISRSS